MTVHIGNAQYESLCGDRDPLYRCSSSRAAHRLAQRWGLEVCPACLGAWRGGEDDA